MPSASRTGTTATTTIQPRTAAPHFPYWSTWPLIHAEQVGFDTIIGRGQLAAESLPHRIVYAGFSLRVLPAQMLAQTRPGASGALLFHACVPTSQFGCAWPQGVPLQIHAMEGDELFVAGGDLAAAHDLVATTRSAELFLYAGVQHLFTDNSLPAYDEDAMTLLTQRVVSFLDDIG